MAEQRKKPLPTSASSTPADVAATDRNGKAVTITSPIAASYPAPHLNNEYGSRSGQAPVHSDACSASMPALIAAA